MFNEIKELLKSGDDAVSQGNYELADTLYKIALNEADSFRDAVGYYHALGKLADLFLLQGNHEKAAGLYQAAFFKAAENKDHGYAATANAKYKLTEEKFVDLNRSSRKAYRQQLKAMRDDVREILMANPDSTTRVEWTKGLLKKTAETIGSILEREFYGAMHKLGIPKTKWCVVGLGSFGRKEMSTHSDIEWAILIEDDTPENVEYFIRLAKYLNIRLMKLGETDINDRHDKTFQGVLVNEKHPIPKAIAADQGFKTPEGKPGEYVLIGGPKKLATFVDGKTFDDKSHLIAAMISSGRLFGDENLFKKFKASCREQLNQKSSLSHVKLAHKFMIADLPSFKQAQTAYEHFFDESKLGKLNCKNYLYRPFNRFVESLSLLSFGIEDDRLDSFSRIEKLSKQGFISAESANKLQMDFAIIAQLRMKLYLHHHQQKEGLCLIGKDSDFPITHELAEEIRQVTKDLELIFKKTQQYVDTKDKRCFYNLFDNYEPQLAVTTTASSVSSSARYHFLPSYERLNGKLERASSCSSLKDFVERSPSPAPSA